MRLPQKIPAEKISCKRSIMNERIRELAEQAGMHRDKFGMYFAGDKHDEDGVDLEKFAELIVRECCEVAHCNFHVDGLTLGGILKEHFGVENGS
jgi:hypothetical protein